MILGGGISKDWKIQWNCSNISQSWKVQWHIGANLNQPGLEDLVTMWENQSWGLGDSVTLEQISQGWKIQLSPPVAVVCSSQFGWSFLGENKLRMRCTTSCLSRSEWLRCTGHLPLSVITSHRSMTEPSCPSFPHLSHSSVTAKDVTHCLSDVKCAFNLFVWPT